MYLKITYSVVVKNPKNFFLKISLFSKKLASEKSTCDYLKIFKI